MSASTAATTAREEAAKARANVLALAQQLRNVKAACRLAGISRSHFYEIKAAFVKHGPGGLIPKPRRKPRMPNQTPPELEALIMNMTALHPTCSYLRISAELRLIGVAATPSAIRGVWRRLRVTRRAQRLMWVEQNTSVISQSTLNSADK